LLAAVLLTSTLGATGYDAAGTAGRWMIDVYQAVLSPRQAASTCNFEPSCSRFAREAIESRGILAGVVIGADRLTRCNTHAWTQHGLAYVGITNGRLRDPVHVPDKLSPAKPHLPLPQAETRVVSAGEPSETSFARWLADRGDWHRAGIEYARTAAQNPDSAIRVEAALLGAEALLRADRPESARLLFAGVLPHAPGTARLGIARALFATDRYEDCRAELAGLGPRFARERTLLSGWSLFREHRFDAAASVFREAGDPEWRPLAALDGHDLPRRSRPLAAALSAVLPGAGQVYTGRVADGVYSLLAVAGSGFLTWWFGSAPERRDRTRVKTVFFGATTALFYAGGVYGAHRAACDFNRVQERRYAARADSLLARVGPATARDNNRPPR